MRPPGRGLRLRRASIHQRARLPWAAAAAAQNYKQRHAQHPTHGHEHLIKAAPAAPRARHRRGPRLLRACTKSAGLAAMPPPSAGFQRPTTFPRCALRASTGCRSQRPQKPAADRRPSPRATRPSSARCFVRRVGINLSQLPTAPNAPTQAPALAVRPASRRCAAPKPQGRAFPAPFRHLPHLARLGPRPALAMGPRSRPPLSCPSTQGPVLFGHAPGLVALESST